MELHPENFEKKRAETLRQNALQAGRAAAALLRENFRNGIISEQKTNPHDLVTALDRQSQLLITNSLLIAQPDSWVLGEEEVVGSPEQDCTRTVQWIVDPIDGTSNFVHGIAFFCVSIAAAINDHVVACAIIDPVTGDEFSANLDGAFHNSQLLRPRIRPPQASANLMTDYPSAEAISTDGTLALDIFGRWVQDFATVRRKVSAAMALAHVAAGWCDATIGFDTKPWDVAAGSHLVQMSGGSYRGLFYGAAEQTVHLAPGFIAQGPGADYASLHFAAQRITAFRAGPEAG